jgi:hypothetical protein
MKVIVEAVVSSDEKVWDAGVRVARAVSELAGVTEVMVYTPQRVIKSPLEQAESDAGGTGLGDRWEHERVGKG